MWPVLCNSSPRPTAGDYPAEAVVTRDDWCDDFIDELIKLRPHATHRFAKTLALHQYDPAEHPRDRARQYDKAQRAAAPSSEPSKRRRKS